VAAPKGNQYWRARTKHGRDKLFSTPDVLWDACVEYFDWVEANPLFEDQAFAFQGVITHDCVTKIRAMTIQGLCLFLDIDDDTWAEYKKRKDFTGIITRAERIIYQQKFSGAAAGLLNPNIIARDLGLADKKEHTGANGGAIEMNTTLSPADAYKKLIDG
jgi:hypothetical protein